MLEIIYVKLNLEFIEKRIKISTQINKEEELINFI